MSSTTPGADAPDLSADVRPLPRRPNLAFERKQAKQLVALLRKRDPGALARVSRFLKRAAAQSNASVKLADAQFAIAREYGFQSWPRLVDYFTALARHEVSGNRERHRDLKSMEAWARTIQAEHKQGRAWTVQFLGSYVPRFYGRTTEQVLASEVTLDDARLAAARMCRYPSWEVMSEALTVDNAPAFDDAPEIKAARALREGRFDEVERLANEHPDTVWRNDLTPWSSVAHDAILREIKEPSPASRRALDWVARHTDLQPALNRMVLGHMRMTVEQMQRLLDLGADPTWAPPNGFSVLEHVIWRCWNGDVVDLIARRVTPRKAFWIAAGLGDAAAVERYFDRNGALTDAARKHRPDFTALGIFPMPSNPAQDDETVIWEAFLVAAFNQRFAVLDVLLEHGFPIDYILWGQTVLHLAVGNGWVQLTEYLVRHGADVNLRGWRPHQSAREMAEETILNPHGRPDALRILELVGGRDPEVIRRDHAKRWAKRVMPTAASVEQAFTFARHDAVMRGLGAVDAEGMFIGLLKQAGLTVAVLADAKVDLARLRAPIRGRFDTLMVKLPEEMTANPEVSAILLDARKIAEDRNDETLTSLHVLLALVQRAPKSILKLIEDAGGSKERVIAAIERAMSN